MKDKTIGELLNDLKHLKPSTILNARLGSLHFWGALMVVGFIWLMGSAIMNAVMLFLMAGFLVSLSLAAVLIISRLPTTTETYYVEPCTRQHYHRHDHYHHAPRRVEMWPEPEPEPEPKRIEQQPRYEVLTPRVKQIAQQPNRVYLPAAKERVRLPVERKRLGGE